MVATFFRVGSPRLYHDADAVERFPETFRLSRTERMGPEGLLAVTDCRTRRHSKTESAKSLALVTLQRA